MTRRALAWGIAAILLLAIGLFFVLESGAGSYSDSFGESALGVAMLAPSAVVGLVLATRRPSNPIGWLLLANVLVFVLGGLAFAYAGHALAHDYSWPGVRLAAVFDTNGWPLLFAPLVAIAFVFPDGHLPSPRWRRVALAGAGSFLLVFVCGMLGDERLDEPFDAVEPYGLLPTGIGDGLSAIGLLGMIVTLVLAFVAVGSRFRAADGLVRAQLKWITYAAASIPLAIMVGTVEAVISDGTGIAAYFALLVPMIAVPVAIGVAVLRYRLYEIDRLINVTLVYAVLTALLAAAFAAIALLGGVALGSGSTVPTAVATLAVALAFRPLRGRVQALVDRRLNPDAYEGLRRIDRFLLDLREGRAEPEQAGAVLAAAVADPGLELFFWLPRDEMHADAKGRPVPKLPSTPAGQTPVRRGELRLGTVVHDPKLLERPALLDAAIVRAGLAIEIARLRVEVRRRLAEVEQSRARIVAAGYEERRRLERDLHDGAQQRLIAIGLDLRHLQQEVEPGATEIRTGLDSAVAALVEAVEELRELASGVRPASLDAGLAPALRELASRAPIATAVDATEERFDPEVEAAAYFVASEGLTNAAKHAAGSRVMLSAARQNGMLVLSVADDGHGGASPIRGSGLTGLMDRVEALGGRLTVTSEPGCGTSLVAKLPCG
jgi:signal transduction histidine kinase